MTIERLRLKSNNGIRVSHNRRDLPTNDIIVAFQGGASVKALAERYGIARNAIARRLSECGISVRNRSEAMYVRMDKASVAERLALTAAAHAAARGSIHLEEHRERVARTRQGTNIKRSPHEFILEQMLKDRGVTCVIQQAIGRYNCDLGAAPVAVEVFGGHWHWHGAHLARSQRRHHSFLDHGWHIIVVWLPHRTTVITETAADYVADFIYAMRRNPTALREYRMIRGTGELEAAGSANDDYIALEPSRTIRRNPTNGRYESIPRHTTPM